MRNDSGVNFVDKPRKKSSSAVLFSVGAFAAIIVIMLIANRRSRIANEIRLPLNNGIVNLSTCDNLLTAISHDNKIYVWDWADLSKKPREGVLESDQGILITSDTVVSVKRANPDRVVVSGLGADKSHKTISLPTKSDTAYLSANRDRSRIVLLLARSNDGNNSSARYDLLDVLIDSGQVQPILTIDSEQSNLGHLSVSDDGNCIVSAGEKNSHGWMCVVDAREKRLMWQKEMPDVRKIYKAAFASDGDTIYVRGSDSTLLLFKTSSGDIIDRLLPIEENKSTYRAQPVQTVAASPNGGLVAATVFGTVYVWDSRTHKILFGENSGHKVISSMVFSPDSGYLATSDMRQGGTIKVWRMPGH